LFAIQLTTEALINLGLQNRAIAPTLMNATSSRSHTILTVSLEQRIDGDVTMNVSHYTKTLRSKLLMVDLAGSERVRRTISKGTRLSEAKSINTSLSALGNVIAALAEQNVTHVPYRDSKLTRLLQDSLGGTASTALIATIGPAAVNYGETLSTLLFAQRCMAVKITPIKHEEIDYAEMCAKLQAQLNAMEGVMSEKILIQQRQYEDTIQDLNVQLEEERTRIIQQPPEYDATASAMPTSSSTAIDNTKFNEELNILLTHLEKLYNNDVEENEIMSLEHCWLKKPLSWQDESPSQELLEAYEHLPNGQLVSLLAYSFTMLKSLAMEVNNLIKSNTEREAEEKLVLEKVFQQENNNQKLRAEEIDAMARNDPRFLAMKKAKQLKEQAAKDGNGEHDEDGEEEVKEPTIGSHLAPLNTLEALTRVEGQFRSNNIPIGAWDRLLIAPQALEQDEGLLPSIHQYESIMDVARSLNTLRISMKQNVIQLQTMFIRKDIHYQNVKKELTAQMTERRKREEEVVNWSYILKYLLASQSKLKKELSQQKKQQNQVQQSLLPDYPHQQHAGRLFSPSIDARLQAEEAEEGLDHHHQHQQQHGKGRKRSFHKKLPQQQHDNADDYDDLETGVAVQQQQQQAVKNVIVNRPLPPRIVMNVNNNATAASTASTASIPTLTSNTNTTTTTTNSNNNANNNHNNHNTNTSLNHSLNHNPLTIPVRDPSPRYQNSYPPSHHSQSQSRHPANSNEEDESDDIFDNQSIISEPPPPPPPPILLSTPFPPSPALSNPTFAIPASRMRKDLPIDRLNPSSSSAAASIASSSSSSATGRLFTRHISTTQLDPNQQQQQQQDDDEEEENDDIGDHPYHPPVRSSSSSLHVRPILTPIAVPEPANTTTHSSSHATYYDDEEVQQQQGQDQDYLEEDDEEAAAEGDAEPFLDMFDDSDYSLTSTTRSFRSAATPNSIPLPRFRKSTTKQQHHQLHLETTEAMMSSAAGAAWFGNMSPLTEDNYSTTRRKQQSAPAPAQHHQRLFSQPREQQQQQQAQQQQPPRDSSRGSRDSRESSNTNKEPKDISTSKGKKGSVVSGGDSNSNNSQNPGKGGKSPSAFAQEIVKTLGVQGTQAMAAMSVIDRVSQITPEQLDKLDPQTREEILQIRKELGIDSFIPSIQLRTQSAEQQHIQRNNNTMQQRASSNPKPAINPTTTSSSSSNRTTSNPRPNTTQHAGGVPMVAVDLMDMRNASSTSPNRTRLVHQEYAQPSNSRANSSQQSHRHQQSQQQPYRSMNGNQSRNNQYNGDEEEDEDDEDDDNYSQLDLRFR